MSKNNTITDLDLKQFCARMYDVENDAQRVVIVGGENLQINADVKIPEQKEFKIERIEVPVIVKETEFKEIPVIIKETQFQTVKIPVIVEKIKIVEVEKPVIKTQFERVEVPVVVREKEPLPTWIKFLLIAQFVSYVILNIVK